MYSDIINQEVTTYKPLMEEIEMAYMAKEAFEWYPKVNHRSARPIKHEDNRFKMKYGRCVLKY